MALLNFLSAIGSIDFFGQKIEKFLKNTYLYVYLIASYKLLFLSIVFIGLTHATIDPNFYIEFFINAVYMDEPKRLTPVNTYNFIDSAAFRWFAVTFSITLIYDISKYFSLIAGGSDIPKKP